VDRAAANSVFRSGLAQDGVFGEVFSDLTRISANQGGIKARRRIPDFPPCLVFGPHMSLR
jgi:hypothetical protein